jgi:hypothetical protein
MAKKRKRTGDELRDLANDLTWYEPSDPTPRHLCPCCDYVTLPERGNYLICPVCFWEDDGLDLDAPDEPSGPNHGTSLREGRANFAKLGACEEAMVKNAIPPTERSRFEHRPRTLRPSRRGRRKR